MEVTLYYNKSDERKINKDIVEFATANGTLKSECSVMNPVLIFDTDLILKCNYCYISEFERYYSIAEAISIRTGLFEVHMKCDVLMSFRQDIYNMRAVVSKQTLPQNGNEYIDDGSLVAENVMFTTTYNFPNGFNDYGEYILITAG